MMTKNKVLLGLIIVALVSRIAPHYPNFTAMGALAFFGASRMKSIWGSLAVVVGAMMVSDLVINNLIYPTGEFVLMYSGSHFTYAGFAAYALLGRKATNMRNGSALLVGGSVAFFLLSNLGVFLSSYSLFPMTWGGLIATYAAAVPFYAPELISTALFSAIAYAAETKISTVKA
jgi:hypothetical protein